MIDVSNEDIKKMRYPYRTHRRLGPGVLRMVWRKFDGEPDFVCDGPRGDCNLCFYMLTSERMTFDASKPYNFGFKKSFAEELSDRGYDISTFEFKIQKLEKKV